MKKAIALSLGLLAMLLLPMHFMAKDVPASNKMVWKVRLSIPDHSDFSVAARSMSEKTTPFGVVPLKGATIPSLAIAAHERNDDIVIDLYAAGEYKRGMKCAELQGLIKNRIASLTTKKGGPVLVASLAPYGIPSFKLLPFQAPGGDSCCSCGALNCCPNAGKCLNCGDCGACCRVAVLLP